MKNDPDIYRELNVLLERHGEIHAYGHTWHPQLGHSTSVEGKYFATRQEANEARNRAMKRLGYTKPRWWQWWRWGEYPIDV